MFTWSSHYLFFSYNLVNNTIKKKARVFQKTKLPGFYNTEPIPNKHYAESRWTSKTPLA